jgi:hypothetical protein
MSATILQFKRPTDPPRLPPYRITPAIWGAIIGFNQRQEGMAHRLSFGAGMHRDLMDAVVGYMQAMSALEGAAGLYRQELLRAMATKCPAAAKRIEQGKPSRRRPKRP